MKRLATVCILAALVVVGGCSNTRQAAYSKLAKAGNAYCENRDNEARDLVVNRVNEGLREAGGRFTFEGVKCDQ